MTYAKGDMVVFKFSKSLKETFNGIIVSRWRRNRTFIYEISSMNHGMSSFTIGQECILKKIS